MDSRYWDNKLHLPSQGPLAEWTEVAGDQVSVTVPGGLNMGTFVLNNLPGQLTCRCTRSPSCAYTCRRSNTQVKDPVIQFSIHWVAETWKHPAHTWGLTSPLGHGEGQAYYAFLSRWGEAYEKFQCSDTSLGTLNTEKLSSAQRVNNCRAAYPLLWLPGTHFLKSRDRNWFHRTEYIPITMSDVTDSRSHPQFKTYAQILKYDI